MRDSELPQVSDVPVAQRTVERRRFALGVLLCLSFLVAARLAAPVWEGIVFGILMAFTLQPVYRALLARLHDHRKTAAALTTMAAGLVSIVAGALSIYVLTRELFQVIDLLQTKVSAASPSGIFGERVLRIVERFGWNEAELTHRLQDQLGRVATYATALAGLLVTTTTTAVVGLVIGCITMYYVLVEWPSIPVHLERMAPLDPLHTRALILEFRDIGRSALVGTMVTALFQGVLGAVGYTISDLPHAVTWGLFTAVASFFPVVGTALVWVPVSLYFLSRGQITHAVVQAAWGLFLIVGIGDYVLRPRFVGRQGKGQPLLMLVSALGGIQVFGLAGIVVGPVLMSLFLAIARIYEREVDLDERANTEPLFREPGAPRERLAPDFSDD
ncbi:MAG TPA: AI-2E family transporter [Polyangiaceae bacterium]|nr:AI-2E family transporter [Polyangiaceae bacterium]